MSEKQNDKVTVSLTYKVGLPNFSSADAQVSYSSEVLNGETPDETYERVLNFVKAKVAERKAELDSLANGGNKTGKENPKLKTPFKLGKKVKQEEPEESEEEETETTSEEAVEEQEEAPKKEPTNSVASKLEALRQKHKLGSVTKSSGNSLLSKLKRT
jgi:hypothetical protein